MIKKTIRRAIRVRYYSQPTVQTISVLDPNFKLANNSTIVSGIQPTGTFHLGNYFGAIKSWHDLNTKVNKDPETKTSLSFFVADLHSLTVPQDYQLLHKQRIEAFASIIACGNDPDTSTIFYQSTIPEIAQLNWILTCFTGMGYLNRMTQWKSKANLKDTANVSDSDALGKVKLGLFGYPVLMASDVLTLKATHVPVGEDQSQHLELTRDIAESFNRSVGGPYFELPKTILTPTKKILNLKNPEKKMSKSDKDPLSKILITESAEDIRKKFRKATTDSIEGKLTFNPVERPGIANLINILAAANDETVEKTTAFVQDLTKKELKDLVADSVIRELDEPSRKYHELMANTDYLRKLSDNGTERARAVADKTLREVMKLVGLTS